MTKKGWIFLFALLLIHLGILINLRFTAWPEMLAYPYFFSNGFKLYADFVYPYPPLLTLILAGFYKILGFKILTLKVISWLFILGSDFFLFLILKNILKKDHLIFLLLVPYLLLQSFLDGNMLWFDNALVLPLVASFYFLTNWLETKRESDLILTSVFLTAAVFIKQTAAIYFLALVAFALFTPLLHSNGVARVAGVVKRFLLIPAILGTLFLIFLVSEGSLKDFWLWSVYYPLTFWSKFPGYRDLSLSLQEKTVFGLVTAPLLGAVLAKRRIFGDERFLLVVAFFLAAIMGIYPRFNYFHLQPLLAISFIVFAIIFTHLEKNWYLLLLYPASLLAIFPTFNYSFNQSVRFYDEADQRIVKTVSVLTSKDEKVFLPGLNSSVYVFADRLPPKPWADNFGWYFEIPGWQEEFIKKFEEDPPAKIFYKVPRQGNWFDLDVYRPQKLVNYMKEHYYRDSEPIEGIELWKIKNE